VQWVLGSWLIGLLLLQSRPLLGLFLGTLVGYLLHLRYSDFRRYFQDTKVVVLSALPGKFVVVRRSLDAARLLFSMRLIQVVQVALVEYGSFVKPDIVRLSTRVRTTRY
jgi:hypothetical protein